MLLPTKTECSRISCEHLRDGFSDMKGNHTTDLYFSWVNSVGISPIDRADHPPLVSDTLDLIQTYASMRSSVKIHTKLDLYCQKWGFPFPISNNRTVISADDFCEACWMASFVLFVFRPDNKQLRTHRPILEWVNAIFKSPHLLQDTFFSPCTLSVEAEWVSALTKSALDPLVNQYFQPVIYVEESDIKNKEQILQNDVSARTWLRGKMLDYFAHKVSNLTAKIQAHITDGTLKYNTYIDNNLLYVILTQIDQTKRYCQCGCGSELVGRQKLWAPGHKEKGREKNPIRNLTKYLGMKKFRGAISDRQYRVLLAEIDRLASEKFKIDPGAKMLRQTIEERVKTLEKQNKVNTVLG